MVRFALQILFLFSASSIISQTGYFKTARDFENNKIVKFDDVGWRSSALGCNVTFYKGDKKVAKFDQHDIFAFVDDSSYYRFYKYAIIHMMIRGEMSFFGLVPTTLSFNPKEKSLTIRGTDKMLLFVSKGPSGDLVLFKRKKLLDLLAGEDDIIALYENDEVDMLGCVLLYNLKYPSPDGFIMDGNKQMTFAALAAKLEEN